MLIGENCVLFFCIAPKERQKIGLLNENTPSIHNSEWYVFDSFAYLGYTLIVKTQPFPCPEIFYISIVMTTTGATAVNHNRKQFVIVRPFRWIATTILLVLIIMRCTIRCWRTVTDIYA